MAGQKDKDYHKLRNPEKYGMNYRVLPYIYRVIKCLDGFNTCRIYKIMTPPTSEESEAEAAYQKLHGKYGFKSMVSDKRRRVNTRKSNQMNKVRDRRILRAKEKQEFQRGLEEDFDNQD